MPTCTLTTFASWFTCAQTVGPVAEMICVIIFAAFFTRLKQNDDFRSALVPALFVATLAAGAFYGMNVIGAALAVAGIILTAIAAVMMRSQNTP